MNAAIRTGVERISSPLVDGLLEHGVLMPTSVPGLWGRSAVFEDVVVGIERLIDTETRADGATFMRFPPLIPRREFERSGFLKSFPHLAGAVHAFQGDHAQHQELLSRIEAGNDWSELVQPTQVMLTPAACYPVYPTLSGSLPPGGRIVDVSSYCFRHEPSLDPTRMVAFRMREQVRAGTPDDVLSFRQEWIERAEAMFAALEVPARPAPASDPFFGRGGRLLAVTQLEQRLKFELLVPIIAEDSPTPVMSFNYHQDHFGEAFGLRSADGATAHTACVGFGLERIALSLFKTHGFDCAGWPTSVRVLLSP